MASRRSPRPISATASSTRSPAPPGEGAAGPNFVILEEISGAIPWFSEVVSTPIKRVDGYWEIPTAPGLGVEVDEAAAAKHPFQQEEIAGLQAIVARDGTIRHLLTSFVVRAAQVLVPGGRLVWLSPLPDLTEATGRQAGLRIETLLTVDMQGFDAALQVLQRR